MLAMVFLMLINAKKCVRSPDPRKQGKSTNFSFFQFSHTIIKTSATYYLKTTKPGPNENAIEVHQTEKSWKKIYQGSPTGPEDLVVVPWFSTFAQLKIFK